MSTEMIEKTITIPRYTVEYDVDASAPDYCSAAPTIYGSGWRRGRIRGELAECSCNGVSAPDWQTVKEALDYFDERPQDLNHPKGLTARYLRAFHDVKSVKLISSSVDQYSWAIILDTYSWREHIGIDPADKGVEGNLDAQSYLDGDVYRVTDELTGESLWGIYADNEAEALEIFKSHYGTDQELAE